MGLLEAGINGMYRKFKWKHHYSFQAMSIFILGLALTACGPATDDQDPEPVHTQVEFKGVIGKTKGESVPAWPEKPIPGEDAPNVIVWLLDDAGFAHLSPYGGIIETPTVERLANAGLTYTNQHSVPLCSPARAALLSGRNHHSVAMGSHIMTPAGFPGYNGRIPKNAASIARVLRDQGYATYAFGKWDQTPMTEASVAGPFELWPSGQGFERFYGFLGGDSNHFAPSVWADHTPVAPSEGNPDYFLTTDLADKAIEYIGGLRAANPQKPFFVYWSTGAVHAPHQAPQAYRDKYKGRFADGWDKAREIIHARQLEKGIIPEGTKLSERKAEIPAWDDVPTEEQRLYARQMEAFAAQLNHTDIEFGRIIDFVERMGELENTIVIITSDNGASAEGGMAGLHNEMYAFNGKKPSFESNMRFFDEWGGPNTINHFHAGWAAAGNTPFPYYKHHIDGGGTHVPLVIHWPKRISKSGIRSQYHHVIDIGPTILDAAGIMPPEYVDGVKQKPFEGTSLAYSYNDEEAASPRTTQYFEIWGNRGIYKDGWKAATIHNHIQPWQRPWPGDLNEDVWRLYHKAEDFSESTDLADKYPEKLKELQAAWEVEASKYGVFPLDPDRRARLIEQINTLGPKASRIEYVPEGAHRIPEALSPPIKQRSFSITARIQNNDSQPLEGVIATSGGVPGGYSFYVKDGVPMFAYNLYNDELFHVRGEKKLPKGKSELVFRFDKNEADNGGTGSLYINGEPVGTGQIRETTRVTFSIEEGFDIGLDEGTAIGTDYSPPFKFTGILEKVIFDLD